ncbi:hypothetical protein M231_02121 [Tremella mesenterica]|uniref:Uncharacterized protein n=1 Tax=Tremella mesenterica TaxID=5217 RepID=A0A4Q1BRR4_TREME|nr:hypothetical protein M231_02121 [Tremella mesenterica]
MSDTRPPPLQRTPSYNSAENGTPSTRSRSPSPIDPDQSFGDSTDQGGRRRSASIPSVSHPELDSPTKRKKGGGFSLENVGRAIGSRFMRTVRRGNLPFLVVFLTCLVVFFSALAGVGYVDETAITNGSVEFVPGSPVHDSSVDRLRPDLERKMEEQRELERQWQRKKRPKDGAWMQKQRDDKAIRRIPPRPITTSSVSQVTMTMEDDDGEIEILKRDLKSLE